MNSSLYHQANDAFALDFEAQMMRAEYVRLLFSEAAHHALGGWWMRDSKTGAIVRYTGLVGTLQDMNDYPHADVRAVAEGHHSDFTFLGADERMKARYRWIRDRRYLEAQKNKAPKSGPYIFRYRVVG